MKAIATVTNERDQVIARSGGPVGGVLALFWGQIAERRSRQLSSPNCRYMFR